VSADILITEKALFQSTGNGYRERIPRRLGAHGSCPLPPKRLPTLLKSSKEARTLQGSSDTSGDTESSQPVDLPSFGAGIAFNPQKKAPKEPGEAAVRVNQGSLAIAGEATEEEVRPLLHV